MVHNIGAMLLACLACYGCQSIPPTREAEQGASVLALKNLVGEECQLQESGASENSNLAKRHFEVFCGRWENPSGRIFEVTSNDGSLDSWMKGGWWNETVNRRLQCRAGEPAKVLDGVEARVVQCQLRNGGWPYIVLIARVAGATYLADGIPAVLPVLEQGIGVVSGNLPPSMAGEGRAKSSAVAELEAKLRGRLYGAGDLRTYYRLMTAGQFYNSVKDFATAANRYREALALHERILGIENPETLDPLMHLALEHSNQGHFTEAQALFDRAEVLAKQALDQSDHARYLSYRALHAANQHQFTEALDYIRKSTVLRRELASQTTGLAAGALGDTGQGAAVTGRADVSVLGNVKASTTVDIVQSLYLEAAMLRRLGDLAQADAVLQEAAETLQQADEAPPSWDPEILGLSAKIAKSRGAAEEWEQRLGSTATRWDEVAPGERPVGITYLNLGQAYRDRRRYADAMVAFRRGIRLIKSRGGGLSFNQLLPFMTTAYALADTQPSKRDALSREMFEAGQLVRGGKTAQGIARAAARLAATEGDTGDLVRELQEKEDERYFSERAYEAEIAQGQTKDNRERLEELRKRIAKVNEQVQEASIQVQAAFPGYNQLMDASVAAKRVTDLVGPGEALLQVLLGDLESFVFLVRQGSVSVHPLPISAREIASTVQQLRTGLQPRSDGTLPRFNVELAHELYRDLLGPVSKELESVNHLITIPTGSLLSFPFGLLITEPPSAIEQHDYSKVKWLANRSAISLLPSVRSFVDLRATAKASTAPKAFIGFGNFVPFTENSLSQVDASLPKECLTDPARLRKHRELLLALGALPVSETEVESVARTFPAALSQKLFGLGFNEAAVRVGPLSDYRIAYFATHGILPAELECQPEPSLVASLSQSPQKGEDGLVAASEILRLRLDADLVVLSACNTGGPGLETGGESLSGLARAFFFAGARTLIVSHWLAENKTTADLMIRMFQHMRDAPDTALSNALRVAQLEIIDGARKSRQPLRSHPLLWGAFTVVGDGAKRIAEL